MANGYKALKDSDGITHYIYAQDEPMSCALACMFMIENQVEQQTHAGGEGRLKVLSFTHPGSLLASQLAGDNSGQGWGTTVANAANTFTGLGVNLTKVGNFWPYGPGYKFQWEKSRIKDGKPALLLIGWYSYKGGKLVRGGGHFVVAARISKQMAVVVLDPLKATLHELRGNNGVYLNHSLSGRIEFVLYTG
jgi:hypothetical protein